MDGRKKKDNWQILRFIHLVNMSSSFPIFVSTRVLTQGLMLARQSLYILSLLASPVLPWVFQDRVSRN
jgi:hypothetical protein